MFACCFGDQVDRAADAVCILIGLQSLIDFNGLDQIGGNGIQFDLTDAGFGRRNVYAVERHIGQARLCAADLHVFAFAFIALERNARQASNRVGHICIRQAANHFGRKHLQDVVGGALAIDGIRFSVSALGSDDHFLRLRADFKYGVGTRHASRLNFDRTRVCLQPDKTHSDGICLRVHTRDREFPLSI